MRAASIKPVTEDVDGCLLVKTAKCIDSGFTMRRWLGCPSYSGVSFGSRGFLLEPFPTIVHRCSFRWN